jgi:predicted nuclease with RNAse H fold
MSSAPLYVGVDVAADRLHCVALDERLRVDATAVFSGAEIPELASWAEGASTIAIDAPAQLSTAPHRDDPSLSPKFAVARCAEIALGRQYGSWVPWVTPTAEPIPGWMATGLATYDALRGRGAAVVEVFPYAGFRELVRPARLPKKSTADGARVRIEALRRAGVEAEDLPMWSHDALDALLAALIAHDHAAGTAAAATCGHDGSAIWLPQPAKG